jgi:tetratricopeptide (TPR) repeat protein
MKFFPICGKPEPIIVQLRPCRVILPSLSISVCLTVLFTFSATAQVSGGSPTSFQRLAQRAEAAKNGGNTPASIALYKRALALNPKWQEGLWYYGSLSYDNNRYAQAVTALRRLTKLNPKLGSAWALLGLSEYGTRNYVASLKDLQKADALGTTKDQSLANVADYHLAVLLNASGKSDVARNMLSSLLLRGTNSEDLQVALGLCLLRVPVLPSQLDPSKDALIHEAGNAAGFIVLKQYDQADPVFKDMLATYPGTPFIHYAYGAMLASNGKYDAAEEQFSKETVVNPQSALAYMEWSFLEAQATHYDEAIRLAQRAVQLSGDSFMAHYLLGSALLSTGKAEAAAPQLEIACRLAPKSPEVRYSLARAYAKLGKSSLAKHEEEEFMILQKQLTSRQSERQHRSADTQ